MKAIHKEKNWKKIQLTDLRGAFAGGGACYKNAPLCPDGQMYPPVEWPTILSAFRATHRSGLTSWPPQVWTDSAVDNGRVIGLIWEICAKYEYGEWDDLSDDKQDAVRKLVCNVHQHLGSSYNDFVIS